ncbi:agrin-like [Schistocerca serialis cubense]|uniref:agrin-like n=1 Tax=Schistocerca serialis cubense TaxID=2023355 RepID=UPI00214EDB60|nr:agrin-like [Schistocerca serialis cubense]
MKRKLFDGRGENVIARRGDRLFAPYVSHKPRQQGIEDCPSACTPDLAPVCGSDGVTYRNLCLLRRKACLHRDRTRLAHPGECETGDRCAALECGPWSRCELSVSGLPTCRCLPCPPTPAHAAPVCGSDGVDYASECELRAAACRDGDRDLTLRYRGPCDPCAEVECEAGGVCQLDEDRRPTCRCEDTCSSGGGQQAPVCASDGRSYRSECEMHRHACLRRQALRIIYRGECNSGSNPCAGVECGPGAQCSVDSGGAARCDCGPPCAPVLRPVCAADGGGHDSACHLRRAACLRGVPPPRVLYAGRCRDAACPACPQAQLSAHRLRPVCGSDLVSYGSECELRRAACALRADIQLLHDGPCDGCENQICNNHAICKVDTSGNPRCVCPEPCEHESGEVRPVCGSDGSTYPSACEMRRAACLLNRSLHVAHEGACGLCPHECSDGSSPVCGSDRRTYRSECELRRASCRLPADSPPLAVLHAGPCLGLPLAPPPPGSEPTTSSPATGGGGASPAAGDGCRGVRCDLGATCELDEEQRPRCACRFSCPPAPAGPRDGWLCASDGALHPSLCHLRHAGCLAGDELRLRPRELCVGMEVKPCGGERPLVSASSGEELDCGSGPNRQDCPPGSYCHQTPAFAKCCSKNVTAALRGCEDEFFGCCPDGKTAAQGPDYAGCPSLCGCNKLGSVSDVCDAETGACSCRPGVGGDKCDRCLHGYWGLPKISEGHDGCIACDCSPLGAVREDCEQMTGRCMCKPGVQGQKCTICTGVNLVLAAEGCVPEEESGTERPGAGRWTVPRRFTQPGDDEAWPMSKSTRHLLAGAPRYHLLAPLDRGDAGARLVTDGSGYGRGLPQRAPEDDAGGRRANDMYYAGMYRPTPATVQALSPLLGDLCSSDADCGVPGSRCDAAACRCRPGRTPSHDRQHCLAYHVPAFDGSSYVQLRGLKAYHKLSIEVEFITYASEGIILYSQQKEDGTGDFVSLAVVDGHVEFRYNLGNGPVWLASEQRVAPGRLHRVTARRYHRDGQLRVDGGPEVAGQSQGPLRALDLRGDAYVGAPPTNVSKVFENAGAQQGLVGCVQLLRLGQVAVRLHEGDPLVVRSHRVTECGHSPCGRLPCLNGGSCTPTGAVSFHCDCQPEYTGAFCESRVNPCSSSPCVSGSTCEVLPHGGFMCKCAPGTKGLSCQDSDTELQDIFIPEFNGASHIELPRLEGVGRAFSLELWFLSRSLNGLLLYNGQLSNGKGDYISLNLVNGHVQFCYNLGSGPANITSTERISPNRWHSVKASRLDRDGTLQLDSGPVAAGQSGPALTELNLELPLYVGGAPPGMEVSHCSNVSSGLDGAVQRLVVNGQSLENLGEDRQGVFQWQGPPCGSRDLPSPCLHGGVCQPLLNAYSCRCPPHFTGAHCQHPNVDSSSNSMAVKFSGKTFFRIPNKILKSTNISQSTNYTDLSSREEDEEYEIYNDYDTHGVDDMYDEDDTEFFDKGRKGERMNRYEIVFRTTELNGLLLWLGKGRNNKGHHFGVTVADGFPEMRFNLGKKQATLQISKSKVYVSDGAWHTLIAYRRQRHGFLQVDDESPIRALALSGPVRLHSNGWLWLGGAPVLPSGLPTAYYTGFQGCIQKVKISKKEFDLIQHTRHQKTVTEYCHENDV